MATKRPARKPQSSKWQRLRGSVWFFPLILVVPFLLLTAFKISGSSVGTYHKIVYGDTHDPNLIFGQPRAIRSDEWLVTSQLTIAQQRAGFPRVNKNLGSGIDMSVIGSIPYKDWSAAFHPENVSYFVMPTEFAFALRWWFMLYILIVSAYFFTLRMMGSKKFAVLFGLATALCPFVFWWYANVTLLTLAYAFLIMILGMRIINDEPVRWLKRFSPWVTKAAHVLGLVYLLLAFGLILYPPFLIPVAIVVAAFLLGYFLQQRPRGKKSRPWLLSRIGMFAAVGIITISIIGAFVATRSDVFHTITNTAYPGKRVVLSGHIHPLQIFDSFLQPQLQDDFRGSHFFTNQSEASNFILLSPFLILPALFLTVYEWRKSKRLDWLFLAMQVATWMFFARIFIPFGSSLYKIFLLTQVPNERLIIGIGLASTILTLLIMKKLIDLKFTTKQLRTPVGIYSALCFVVVLGIGLTVRHNYPQFISFLPKLLLLTLGFSAIIYFVLMRRLMIVGTLLLLFSAASVARIHPLYRGLGWLEKNQVSDYIAKSPRDSTWVTGDHLLFENLGTVSGRDSISGVQPYPELDIWKQADPSASDIYNRYAHVVFISKPEFTSALNLVQKDFFDVGLTCSPFVTKNVDYVLDPAVIESPCLTLKDKITYPSITFYIYQVTPEPAQ